MGVKHFKPITPSTRNMTVLDYKEITKKTPEKSLPPSDSEKKRRRSSYTSGKRISILIRGSPGTPEQNRSQGKAGE